MNHTRNYFLNIFTTYVITDWSIIKIDKEIFHNIDLSSLDDPLKNHEIRNEIFSFKPYKAPGPDGLHPFFFKKYWQLWEVRS